MRGLQISKRVSWASDLNLCQVKLFLSDESPSQVGLVGQDHLQAKETWPWQSGAAGSSDDNLPPGFEGIQPANALQNKLSQIPVVQWKCPSRFVLDPTWQVAAGEESKEMEFENQREMRVLEAVYPRPSAIPPNPASPTGEPYYNDQHTPDIPITGIEDEDTPPDTSSSMPPPTTIMPSNSVNGLPPPSMVPGIEPGVVSAAFSALNAAMANTTQGNLIDPNLLFKILSDPSLIEKLSSHGPSTSNQQISPPPPMPTLPPSISLSEPSPPLPVHARPSHHLPYSAPSSSFGTNYPQLSRAGPVHVPAPIPVSVSNLSAPPPPTPEVNLPAKKDLNYYKSLIQQHGGEKQESINTNTNNNNSNSNNHKTRDMKPKVMKPCLYYNSVRGCRNGSSCVFLHDSSSQRVSSSSMPEAQSAKRLKMDREITGT